MSCKIDELMDIVVAGDDLAAEDAAFLCQRLDGFAWYRALERAGIAASKERKGAAQSRASDDPLSPRIGPDRLPVRGTGRE